MKTARFTYKRHHGGGTWVGGWVGGYRIEALVFAKPADFREWEVGGDSRISKFWIQCRKDRVTTFNWQRGADVEPCDHNTARLVDVLRRGLAFAVFGE
jgi:hypothetical protein